MEIGDKAEYHVVDIAVSVRILGEPQEMSQNELAESNEIPQSTRSV